MTTLPKLTLCVLLWAQTVPLLGPGAVLKAQTAPLPKAAEPSYWVTSDSERIARAKPQVVGKCPVHGPLYNGEVMIIYNRRTSGQLKVCLFCLSDLLERNLPKVEEPE